ncbi:hypothetical protein NM688_g7179 [Phlebia brevispora]|uniref:Uncharacterized protein n=1 Tax=Phlebia brevispora TaxID=194682 RepID=A0ACC1S896_9APHY|nr:hypothetical protein NM688_g7179 [Phlebia brevispora]
MASKGGSEVKHPPDHLQAPESPPASNALQSDTIVKTLEVERNSPARWLAPFVVSLVSGCVVLMLRDKLAPAARRRKLAYWILGWTVTTTEMFLCTVEPSGFQLNETSRIIDMSREGQESAPMDSDMQARLVLWWPLHGYAKDGHAGQNRREHRNFVRSHLSDGMVTKYIEREKIWDRNTTLSDRIAFKWAGIWSSVETRASVEDILRSGLHREDPELPELYPQREIRRGVYHIANILDFKMMSTGAKIFSLGSLYTPIAVGYYCNNPKILSAVRPFILVSIFWNIVLNARRYQFWEGPLGYSDPKRGTILHVLYLDFILTSQKRRAAQESSENPDVD